jgi:hypothetical protein
MDFSGARRKLMSIEAPPDAQNPFRDPDRLMAANINPVTGLCSDYLNHFSEAIMLLDFVLHIPECRADLESWRPVGYRDHFMASDLRHRDLAIAAYGAMAPSTRRQFDATCEALNAMILATRASLKEDLPEAAGVRLVTDAMARLKSLFARASAIIRGLDLEPDEPFVADLAPAASAQPAP